MASELVVLSNKPLPVEVAHRALITAFPNAVSYELSSLGLTMHVEAQQGTVVSVCESVEIELEGAGQELLTDPASGYRYWTDIAIPDHSLAQPARAALEVMARAVDGHISEKW